MPITQQARLRERGGDQPQTFITRVPVELAILLRAYAAEHNLSINAAMVAAFRQYLQIATSPHA